MLTNAGVDLHASAGYNTAAQPAAANYVAITANTSNPAAGDTTLAGELAAAGGGLIRKQGVYAHTNGTASVTVTAVFTGNANDSYPVVAAKAGLFNAASSGTMAHESKLTVSAVETTATISAPGDQLTVQFQISIANV